MLLPRRCVRGVVVAVLAAAAADGDGGGAAWKRGTAGLRGGDMKRPCSVEVLRCSGGAVGAFSFVFELWKNCLVRKMSKAFFEKWGKGERREIS